MKILIVEDDFYSRKYLHDLLVLEQYECKAVANGEEGLAMYKQFQPEIIISDIQMPIMNGLEMLEKLRKIKSDVIVIMTTAFGSEEFAIQALRLGANNYLKKPISDHELLPILNKYKAFIDNKSGNDNLTGVIIRNEFSLVFDTNMKSISSVAERLVKSIETNFDNSELTNIELGLVELITNAVEHGNMQITSDEKKEALANDTISQLYIDRMTDPTVASRKVMIDYRYDLTGCQWIISDEGMGFDWESIPNPTRDGNLLELSGRGIFISRFLFDELEYIGGGNIVRVKKYFNKMK